MILRLIRKITITDRNPAVFRDGGLGHIGMNDKQKTVSADLPPVPRIDASTLLASGREIILVHKDNEYRLRLTSNDKLILTK